MTAIDTYLLLRAFCDELGRCGVRHACTSPGSRNSPIVLSLTREPQIRCWSHIDERAAAFFALGAAKARFEPVALTCTSGSAAAHYLPAVIEAYHARIPLIVLTADRPPELREVGAGQTIDQLKLYGGVVKWFFEVGVQEATADRLRWIRALACRAYETAFDEDRAGPVHLNFPLREPLVLDAELPPDPVPGRPGGAPWVRQSWTVPVTSPDPLELPERGVVVVGRQEIHGLGSLGSHAADFADRLAYPLLADPLCDARFGRAAIARYDMLLRDPTLAAELTPELVVRVGDLPTSKPLRTWLASLGPDVRQMLLDPADAWQDPAAVVTDRFAGSAIHALYSWLSESQPGFPPRPREDRTWLQRWHAADDAADAAIQEALGDGLSEPAVAAALSELPGEVTLFVASSMPIRDLELFGGTRGRRGGCRVLCNRGANGIDGTVSTAYGVAAVSPGPVVLLIGDVALAHDMGGLIANLRLRRWITIVLINNDGGGIFHFLPVAGLQDAFEEHIATPHGLDFADAAKLYGCEYVRPRTLAEFNQAVFDSTSVRNTTLIEVRTDRVANRELHRAVETRALAALENLR